MDTSATVLTGGAFGMGGLVGSACGVATRGWCTWAQALGAVCIVGLGTVAFWKTFAGSLFLPLKTEKDRPDR